MKAVAICWSYGRESLNELLSMWCRQTKPLPLLVWLDGCVTPHVHPSLWGRTWPGNTEVSGGPVHFHYAPRLTHGRSLALMRRASIEHAKRLFELGPDDAFLVLEDDDFYAPRHAEETVRALESAEWTGALRTGLQLDASSSPQLVEASGGPGAHAAWAMRLGLYEAAGGYIETEYDDVDLSHRIGWGRCTPHRAVTYVRRYHQGNLSRVGFDVARARRSAPLAARFEPATWSEELETLRRWCEAADFG